MKKSGFTSQTSEPLIVVDESAEDPSKFQTDQGSSSSPSPTNSNLNPFLLSPWNVRETRKLSLPSPQCSGITASQVRRLSERDNSGPGPRQTEFLATLSSAPAPTPGGRRHSVVTISKVPPTLFGRSRRESVAGMPGRILGSRRESMVGPPSTEPRGSVHNLQLDIMDDIVQSRKVRLKLWNTSREKMCEVQDDAGFSQKYVGSRRYSDFVGTTLAPIPSSRRRASALPQMDQQQLEQQQLEQLEEPSKNNASGIVCSNTDLLSILSSLTSSATEIDQCGIKWDKKLSAEQKRSRLKSNRSNSFDASILHRVDQTKVPCDWFLKRHQPMSRKAKNKEQNIKITFLQETHKSSSTTTATTAAAAVSTAATSYSSSSAAAIKKEVRNKVLWDENSGSVVDAEILGNAIEDFLRRDSKASTSSAAEQQPPKKGTKTTKGWFTKTEAEDSGNPSCESSICATLKDLFVK